MHVRGQHAQRPRGAQGRQKIHATQQRGLGAAWVPHAGSLPAHCPATPRWATTTRACTIRSGMVSASSSELKPRRSKKFLAMVLRVVPRKRRCFHLPQVHARGLRRTRTRASCGACLLALRPLRAPPAPQLATGCSDQAQRRAARAAGLQAVMRAAAQRAPSPSASALPPALAVCTPNCNRGHQMAQALAAAGCASRRAFKARTLLIYPAADKNIATKLKRCLAPWHAVGHGLCCALTRGPTASQVATPCQ